MTGPGKEVVQTVKLAAREKKPLVISGDSRVRLGVLVREVEEMKSRLKQDGDESGGVFLTQSASGKYIGTYYSASELFTLSEGRDFVVENRSPVASDVLVYRDLEP